MTDLNAIPNHVIAIIAVYLLGGEIDYIHPEDIALKLYEIAPSRFAWRKYEERVDLGAVRVALRDAKKKKNGTLLIGDNINGWILSEEGNRVIKKIKVSEIQGQDLIIHRKKSVEAGLESERIRMYQTNAYKKFISGKTEDITIQDFFKFARVNEYFSKNSRQRRFAFISSAVANDERLETLWNALQSKYIGQDSHE